MNEGYSETLQDIASSNPTPGGGSVSALVLAHGHALAVMVSRLTLSRDRWIDGHAAARDIISMSGEGMNDSMAMADADAESFDLVMEAYRMPRNNDDEISLRNTAIQMATIGAAKSPLSIARESLALLDSTLELAKFGNSNALTDLAASAELARASFIIASMNVRINLDSIDGDESANISSELSSIEDDVNASYAKINTVIRERLGW